MTDPDRKTGVMWSAIILTGGRASRLGRDKATMPIGGVRALDRLLHALPHDVPIVVVGPDPGDLPRQVQRCREDPPGGGPAAGVAAGLAHVSTPIVGVIATDMPFAASVLPTLIPSLSDDVDGVLAVDRSGRRQYLCGVFRTDSLRGVFTESVHHHAMHAPLSKLQLADFPIEDDRLLFDIDTVDDLEHAQQMVKE
jgi:molybdopterin-guanine dinucleotide biosynthesis protein A